MHNIQRTLEKKPHFGWAPIKCYVSEKEMKHHTKQKKLTDKRINIQKPEITE